MGPGGQPDLSQLLAQAQQMRQELETAQAELAEAEVTGAAGGGLVTVTMSGAGEVTSVLIDPSAVDPDEVETLQDLVLAAIRAAGEEQRELVEEKMGPLSEGMSGLPGLPGF